MVTERQRRLVKRLVRLRAFKVFESMRLPMIRARWGFGWLLKRLKAAQVVDDLHHAPCCPANHYHRMRLVFRPCTCGSAIEAQLIGIGMKYSGPPAGEPHD